MGEQNQKVGPNTTSGEQEVLFPFIICAMYLLVSWDCRVQTLNNNIYIVTVLFVPVGRQSAYYFSQKYIQIGNEINKVK